MENLLFSSVLNKMGKKKITRHQLIYQQALPPQHFLQFYDMELSTVPPIEEKVWQTRPHNKKFGLQSLPR